MAMAMAMVMAMVVQHVKLTMKSRGFGALIVAGECAVWRVELHDSIAMRGRGRGNSTRQSGRWLCDGP